MGLHRPRAPLTDGLRGLKYCLGRVTGHVNSKVSSHRSMPKGAPSIALTSTEEEGKKGLLEGSSIIDTYHADEMATVRHQKVLSSTYVVTLLHMIGLDPPCSRHLRALASFPFLAASIRKVEQQPPMTSFTHFSSSCLTSTSFFTCTPLWTPCVLVNGATPPSLLLGAAGGYVGLTGSNKH